MQTRYPIYVISKGRWKYNLTAKALATMGLDFRLVVEPSEASEYAKSEFADNILILPFDNLGQGSIPARNFVWDHAENISNKHWILDDNIAKFFRLNNNARIYCKSGGIFRAAEDFTDRYSNVGLSGFQYSNFAHDRVSVPPYRLNTRIYSCILINHQVPHRWRGKYNEDTDLSLRVLKDGWATILFNAFLQDKTGTMRLDGGNTDDLYKDDGRLKMAQYLQEQHPDCCTITEKWGRFQHKVDYTRFSSIRLIRDTTVHINTEPNEYGMVLRRVEGEPETVVGTPR
jgi:hypothetical protein